MQNESLELLEKWGASEANFSGQQTYIDKINAESNPTEEDSNPFFINTNNDTASITASESISDDLKNLTETKVNDMKEALLENVFANELTAFFREHKRMMNHSERNRTLNILKKMIVKGQIYVNQIGKIVVRKGSNYTPPTKKRKKK